MVVVHDCRYSQKVVFTITDWPVSHCRNTIDLTWPGRTTNSAACRKTRTATRALSWDDALLVLQVWMTHVCFGGRISLWFYSRILRGFFCAACSSSAADKSKNFTTIRIIVRVRRGELRFSLPRMMNSSFTLKLYRSSQTVNIGIIYFRNNTCLHFNNFVLGMKLSL